MKITKKVLMLLVPTITVAIAISGFKPNYSLNNNMKNNFNNNLNNNNNLVLFSDIKNKTNNSMKEFKGKGIVAKDNEQANLLTGNKGQEIKPSVQNKYLIKNGQAAKQSPQNNQDITTEDNLIKNNSDDIDEKIYGLTYDAEKILLYNG